MNLEQPIAGAGELLTVVWLIFGIVLLLLGAAFIAGWFDWLLGVIGIVMGVISMFSGKSSVVVGEKFGPHVTDMGRCGIYPRDWRCNRHRHGCDQYVQRKE